MAGPQDGYISRFQFSVSTSALALSLMAAPAFAQQSATDPGVLAAQDDEVIENQIVVTGTLIRGTPEDTALPVEVFSSEELTAEGQTSPLDFIKDIPAVGSVLGDSNQFAQGAQGLNGVGTINLRNLGPQRTLVLLNGHRTIQAAGAGISDTNLLPLFALERVELLKDGAAVTYGSDAVAGVANFITRDNFEGVEVQADYTFIDDSDGDWTASILGGINLGADANILAGFGYRHRSPLNAIDRDFANQPFEVNPAGYSGISSIGTYIPLGFIGGAVRPIAGPQRDANCEPLGGVEGTLGSGLATCYYQYTDYNNLVEDQDFYQAFASMNVDLSDDFRFNADALWARSKTLTVLSPSYLTSKGPRGIGLGTPYLIPRNNPGFDDYIAQTGNTDTAIGALVGVYRPLSLGGNPIYGEPFGGQGEAVANSWRVSAGFEHDLGDTIVASLQGTYIDSGSRDFSRDYLSFRLQNAINGFGGPDCDIATGSPGVGNCYFFNPFSNAIPVNPQTGQVNPGYVPGNENREDVIAALFEESGVIDNETQYVVDALVSGSLPGFDLGAGPVAFGVGAQYRKSTFRSRPISVFSDEAQFPCPSPGQELGETNSSGYTCNTPVGPFAFLGSFNDVEVEQDIYAVFGEVLVPVFDRLEVTLALRYEDYGEPVGSTLDPKASFRFEPLDWLVLRGSVGTTFRGPLAGQVTTNSVTALQSITAAGSNFLSVDTRGNPDLSPETAFTYNVGAVIQTGGFNASIDYWSYDFEDQIINQSANAIADTIAPGPSRLADCDSPLRPLITFESGTCVTGTTSGANIVRIATQTVNGPPVETRGVDFEADYTSDLSANLVATIGIAGTWTIDYKVDPFFVNGVQVAEAFNGVGFSNFDRTAPAISELRANAFANFNFGGLNARYIVRYGSGVDDDRYDDPLFADLPQARAAPEPRPESFYGRDGEDSWQHDLTLLYDLPFDFAQVQLQGSVNNIFDEDPPVARLELGYNPFLGTPLGRTYRLGIKAGF
ncbi:TonB-dependent receptor [Altererythrobacter aurantiacus]|uniref:TonB-dependent receptor n=1 Tax=Parapontixanthobacter aurantiacus TaxID=1463599 RepID=A0A844ZJ68_9SPHN|nr:TonB-dependent receptor [Parapontixanthobacter aurantiacus]MXO86957.1 TonB-dependent receptor [Parapontixanthobacter aurantiacus]